MWKWFGVGFSLTLGYLFANLLFKMAMIGWFIIMSGPSPKPGIGV